MRHIDINDVKPGMILARTVINENMMVVLAKGKLLTLAHITRLKFLGIQDLYIQDEFEERQQEIQKLLSESHAFVAEFKEVVSIVEGIFEEVSGTKQVPVAKMKKLIDDTVTDMVMKSGAIDFLYEVKSMDNYTYNHSLRVSILAGVLAKWMRYDKEQVKEIILAGFLHDIGKTQLDKSILQKNADRLGTADRKLYEEHSVLGYQLLLEKKDVSKAVKRAVLQHHENNDGTGFPNQAKGVAIHDYAKLIAVVDFYDLFTSERESYMKQTPFSALEVIGRQMYSTLDPRFCIPFILNVRQSFLGSEVLLSDQRRGIIVQFPDAYETLPLVKVSDHEIVDLNRHKDLKILEYNP